MNAYREKIRSLKEVKTDCDRLRSEGQKIVFTNGCFDLLHPGHTRYLEEARRLGDYLVVAVNSDRSVRSIKGPDRPILGEDVRSEMLAALGFVDAVLLFDEDTPLEVIQVLVPDVLVKGGDWAEDEIVGSDVVKQAGGQVKRIPFVSGFSTTDLIDQIKKTPS
jgi:D-beta-D-heptose 7-phosphate kinase/D-beta-D-heptose 1-phosphate adenosyltransferase